MLRFIKCSVPIYLTNKMFRFNIVLVLQIIVLYQFQDTSSKDIIHRQNALENLEYIYEKNKVASPIDCHMDRSLKDLWNNIKQTAKNMWNAIKNLAEDTMKKIKVWIEQVKVKADRILQEFEKRLRELKSKAIAIIQNMFGDNGIVKKCIQKQNEKIDSILKRILSGINSCISDKINQLQKQTNYQIILDDTDIMLKIEAKLNKCQEKKEEPENCLLGVRKEIAEETNEMENEILKRRVESRNIIDDILDAIVSCSTQGLIEASSNVTNVTLEIINCIVES